MGSEQLQPQQCYSELHIVRSTMKRGVGRILNLGGQTVDSKVNIYLLYLCLQKILGDQILHS